MHTNKDKNTVEEKLLISLYPKLYHMAVLDSHQGIKANGLLSTRALLDLYGIKGKRRKKLLCERRDRIVKIENPNLPHPAYLRDQKPMNDEKLRKVLKNGMLPCQWYELLNGKVFFWLTKNRLHRMIKAYHGHQHLLLVLNTKKLVEDYSEKIWLSPMNSGCTKPFPHPRDENTFSKIENYPWEKRKNKGIDNVVAELCVDDKVENVEKYIEAAFRT